MRSKDKLEEFGVYGMIIFLS